MAQVGSKLLPSWLQAGPNLRHYQFLWSFTNVQKQTSKKQCFSSMFEHFPYTK